MSAVWRAARAAVRRRRVQTTVIGLVVLCATTTVLLALALLSAASAPFDRAYSAQRGAHVSATYDPARVSDAQLTETARRPGVAAASGPFHQAVVTVPGDWLWMPRGPLTVVGRAGPDGPVDRIDVLAGRWASAPGEIVVNWDIGGSPYEELLGTKLESPGLPALTVVGFATSMSRSAGAWVTPEQVTQLRPASVQMLYRFTDASSPAAVRDGLSGIVAGLPEGSLTASQSYFTLKKAFSSRADAYLPFMGLFGVLGLLVSALIVANVVSGAVVAGYRHIGVLKAMGFTPNQVVAVYLTMTGVPAVVGCLLGTLAGGALAGPFLQVAFSGTETGNAVVNTVDPWVHAVCLLGFPALVLVTALVPALRAHRLPAARAISSAGVSRAGRGLRVQRALAATGLPTPVGLGLGQPFARPARTLMTMAAIVLGVTTVTVSTGLTGTMLAYAETGPGGGGPTVTVQTGAPLNGLPSLRLGDAEIEERLRSLPGAREVRASALSQVSLVGYTQPVFADFHRGDLSSYASRLADGRVPRAAGEVVAGPGFLTERGLSVGSGVTLELDGRRVSGTVVGELVDGDARAFSTSWETLRVLAPEVRARQYQVGLAPGSDARAYAAAVDALDPGLRAEVNEFGSAAATVVVGFSSVFTVLLSVVTALGVFNTVLLNVRERRRDLGMLKSIGMTPRQVMVMTVTSVTGVGAVAGLIGIPLGMVAHRLIVDNVGIVSFTGSMKDVWHAPQLAGLLLAGVVIAVLGALVPARTAARTTIAAALHTE
ncbi:FtsX-like permease family protein [Streptomyces sp. NPDC059985]|uniref:FtsX-like permease family protein n=1 Tax=Streptomyces sp. NPDC059985 TaxID=3347025 RepID=UPI0036A4490A